VSPTIIHTRATIKETATGAGSSTRGSDIYKLLANEVNAFLSEADNKYDVVEDRNESGDIQLFHVDTVQCAYNLRVRRRYSRRIT
jgi:hypothetical protein